MKALRRSNTSSTNQPSSSSPALSWIHLRSLLIIASSPVHDRGTLKSPWSQRKRKQALSRSYWNSLFAADGRLRDGGIKFLKRARNRGIDSSIRAEVWPFLLGVYDLKSSKVERNAVKVQKRKEYEKLRVRCRTISNHSDQGNTLVALDRIYSEEWRDLIEDPYSSNISENETSRFSHSLWSGNEDQPVYDRSPNYTSNLDREDDNGEIIHINAFLPETDSSDSDSYVDMLPSAKEPYPKLIKNATIKVDTSNQTVEDFISWQRIIRLDAIRADPEYLAHSPTQAGITEAAAKRYAHAVGLKEYDHLQPSMIYHASRLVAVLEAYAIYDPEIGYCQGMSDLLSPILTVVEDDYEAFWCFVGFMRKARHNFRLDELGIRRQLTIVSRIIRSKDAHLYQHLEKLQAEDCFFVYRMVVVLFRRELSFEQTVCLWEVMWADQAAIRAGIGRSAWGRMRLRAPPTDDLLLYAIAACVLQRKLIIERYGSMDEIMRECNSMAGKLDVWRLLDDAHHLVVTLHDKIHLPLENF